MYDKAHIYGGAWVYGDAEVFGKARVFGDARVFDKAEVFGNACVTDKARVSNKARVDSNMYIMSSILYTNSPIDWTLHRTTDGHILHIGDKSGTIDEHQTICDSDSWIEDNEPDTIRAARSEYQAIIDLCRTRVARWNH